MKRFNLLLLVTSSLMLSVVAIAATRPHYGGTLRITLRETPQTMEPAELARAGASNVSRLIFDTLVTLNDRGQPQPSLATSWQAEPGNQRWRFSVRTGVSFSDGTPLNATAVAASLRSANPEWKVLPSGDAVVIECGIPNFDLPAELALARNAVALGDQQPVGTGPFLVSQWLPGKHLTLTANEQYWQGRPFVDSIEIEFGKSDREQLTALDLGRADISEVAPENIRRARADGRTLVTSAPTDLLALVFSAPSRSEEETHARNALALSIDTSAINNVVLQGGGEPAGALLPNWLSGYEFVFSTPTNLERARQERSQAKQAASAVLGYNALDPVAHTVAERVLLNARDAGITLQLTTEGHSDMLLVRLPIASFDSQTALTELAKTLKLPEPKFTSSSITDFYSAEKALLQSRQIIPLLHLRTGAAIRTNLRGFSILPEGSWNLNNAWLAAEKP